MRIGHEWTGREKKGIQWFYARSGLIKSEPEWIGVERSSRDRKGVEFNGFKCFFRRAVFGSSPSLGSRCMRMIEIF